MDGCFEDAPTQHGQEGKEEKFTDGLPPFGWVTEQGPGGIEDEDQPQNHRYPKQDRKAHGRDYCLKDSWIGRREKGALRLEWDGVFDCSVCNCTTTVLTPHLVEGVGVEPTILNFSRVQLVTTGRLNRSGGDCR
jgi:hypothetical protein